MTSELDSLVWRSSSKKMKSRRERQKFKDYDVNHFAVAVQQQKDKTKSRWTMMSWIALPKRSSRKRTTEDANDEKIEDYGVNDFAVAVQQKDTQINFGKDTRREMTLESTRLKAIAALNCIHSKKYNKSRTVRRWLQMNEAEKHTIKFCTRQHEQTNKIEINDDDEADHPKGLLGPDWRKRGEIL
ncbi:hypothetical protein DAPPUDRAFT_117861 [Daphnia pulex]|uniref:Uncharacterized protein n=1 Tax=Daphnia pulex TaxID=6669 RepID=E9HTZ6_DAPPU|nr:hypothetical protein DAPPUDRAFT_117861 [Daphnia pulex]|eukprot:EFX64776.1 hypothetical protein DAPPUDRAFT_117861 [Daphnia pulex]